MGRTQEKITQADIREPEDPRPRHQIHPEGFLVTTVQSYAQVLRL